MNLNRAIDLWLRGFANIIAAQCSIADGCDVANEDSTPEQ